jgi:hypothetical protein
VSLVILRHQQHEADQGRLMVFSCKLFVCVRYQPELAFQAWQMTPFAQVFRFFHGAWPGTATKHDYSALTNPAAGDQPGNSEAEDEGGLQRQHA